MESKILRLALPTPLRRLFDYLPPQSIDPNSLIPGVRLRVPFQNRSLIGVLIEIADHSSIPAQKLKRAKEVLDQAPILSNDVYEICQWAANYYHYSLGEIFAAALPPALRQFKNFQLKSNKKILHVENAAEKKDANQFDLNEAQQIAIQKISAALNGFQVFLLEGVTGSGKTEVYLNVIEKVIAAGKQVLVLVPEINLTPQTIDHFQKRFQQQTVLIHSGIADQKRLQAWHAAKTGAAKIVIGTRSAVFTSFENLGLIIIDEEHDASFKQQNRFRYHARDVGIMRAKLNNIPIILASATPSLETLHNVQRQRFSYLSLPERAGIAQLPTFQLVDLREEIVEEGLSATLLNAIQEEIGKKNQVLLFLNRRGFAPVLYCTSCHFIVECRRCAARMVYHRSPQRLKCHHCDAQKEIPNQCENCGCATLQPLGFGTQRLEKILHNHFPDVALLRVDRDSTRKKGAMENMLAQVHQQKPAILIGTQMLAKGHHFPDVTLVAIIDADSGLLSADFRAAEHMGQLFLQVAGRAGRGNKLGRVILQTRNPEHFLIQAILQHNYQSFAQRLLKEREESHMPPYSYFALFRSEAYQENLAHDFLQFVKSNAQQNSSIEILGPAPALLPKRKGMYCQHLLIKAKRRDELQQFLQQQLVQLEKFSGNHAVKWSLDVDPISVL